MRTRHQGKNAEHLIPRLASPQPVAECLGPSVSAFLLANGFAELGRRYIRVRPHSKRLRLLEDYGK